MNTFLSHINTQAQLLRINFFRKLSRLLFVLFGLIMLLISIVLLIGNSFVITTVENLLGIQGQGDNVFNDDTYVILTLIYVSGIFSFLLSASFFLIAWLCHSNIKNWEYISELEENSELVYLNSLH